MKPIKIFIIMLLILFSTLSFSHIKATADESNFYYTNNVEHLFTHSLIAYPEIAFNNKNSMKIHYETDCITSNEFNNILHNLYINNYILVSINECFSVENGIARKNKIKVPINKKPLILSFDDVNYDQKKLGKGMVDKIILDNNNNIATSTKFNNKEVIEYDKEFINILENFIKKHNDFSLNGARGTICLTGYDGILGYRTSHSNTTNIESEIKLAKQVVNKLKSLGWNFACHSYGHYHMNKLSYTKFKNEINLWNEEVKPLIGETSIYVYPYGEWEVFNNGNISDKHQLLTENGFNLFCGVGMKTFYSYLPNKNKHKVLFMDRKCIDGRTLKSNNKELHNFFNPLQILDKSRP